jgi:hypothetical protein
MLLDASILKEKRKEKKTNDQPLPSEAHDMILAL